MRSGKTTAAPRRLKATGRHLAAEAGLARSRTARSSGSHGPRGQVLPLAPPGITGAPVRPSCALLSDPVHPRRPVPDGARSAFSPAVRSWTVIGVAGYAAGYGGITAAKLSTTAGHGGNTSDGSSRTWPPSHTTAY